MAEFRWFGHNSFRIKSRDATILTDPVDRSTGYVMAKQTADIVTISHDRTAHTNLNAVRPEYKLISGPGEYEMENIFITGIRTFDNGIASSNGSYNTAYLFEIEGMIICHLGDISRAPNSEQVEAMAQSDILLIPAGGSPVISQEQAAELVALLEPKVVIPMQFATEIGDKNLGGVEPFARLIGVNLPEPVDKYVVKSSDLTEAMHMVVLRPESEPARR
jgi:L-ascorbate metabolism protein UlaG (beta-lactamase superfamily)